MENYQVTPFAGEWDEDPEIFLSWFLQCMGTVDDKTKARQFVYYLQADSDADEWFEELPGEEKKNWVTIEVLFRKRWLKEDLLGIKETVTTENKPQGPQPTSTPVPATSADSTTALATQIVTTAPHIPEIGHDTCVATSQSPALAENGKNAKIITTKAQISQNFAVFSPQTPSYTFFNSPELSSTTISSEMQSTAADFTQNHQKVEFSPTYTEITSKIPSPSVIELENDVARVHASPPSHNDDVLRHSTLSTSASSLQVSSTGHQKSVPLRDFFEPQPPPESLASTIIVLALETRSDSIGFTENNQKVEKSPIFTQKAPEPIISGHLKCMDDIDTSPALTTTVTALETRSATTDFMKIYKKVEKSTTFNQNHSKSLVSGCFSTVLLPMPSISPTKHPCYLSGDENVHFVLCYLSVLFLISYFNFAII